MINDLLNLFREGLKGLLAGVANDEEDAVEPAERGELVDKSVEPS